MGLFDKIKNILFEDDEEIDAMPVYTKEEVKENSMAELDERNEPFVSDPIRTNDNSRFNNVKRDIDFNFSDEDVLGEITGESNAIQDDNQDDNKDEVVISVKKEEKSSIFPSFDEDEFERLNSRINYNENKIKREASNGEGPVSPTRKANNIFSSTTTEEKRNNDLDRYKINPNKEGGRKPFRPSPVISPVYGILDKNYRKDEIVDKKDGIKREKKIKQEDSYNEKKNVVAAPKQEVNNGVVDIDSVRKKAYGELENLEKQATISSVLNKDVKVKKMKVEDVSIPIDDIENEKNNKIELSVEEQLDDKEFEVTNIIDVHEDKDIVDRKLNNTSHIKEEKKSMPKALDEMEKTSTLQILDDIEKELNSIKPISKEESLKEDEELKERLERSDTLETDLFNLIDSMYEDGEEEDDD